MRKNLLLASCLVVALTLLVLDVDGVNALAKVGNLRIEGGGVVEDGEIFIVPPGSQKVTVAFDYTGASRSTIGIRVEGVGGLRLFESRSRYSGDSSATVDVRGVDIFEYLAEKVEDTSRDVVSVVREIVNATSISSGEVFEHLTSIENLTGTVSGQLDVIESLALKGEAATAAQDMRSALEEIELDLEDAKELEVSDVEGRIAKAELMSGPADSLYAAAAKVAEAVEDVKSAALPESDGTWSYTVSARLTEGTNVQDAIADSIEFEVATAGTSGSATATDSPSDPTAEATERSGGEAGGISPRSSRTPEAAGTATVVTSGENGSEAPGSATATRATPGRGNATKPTSDQDEDSDASDAAEPAGATDSPAESSDSGNESGQGEQNDQDGGSDDGDSASPLPTWTVPAGDASGGSAADQDSTVSPDSEGGLNLGILFLGILALIAIAYWLRRRM